MRIEHSFFSWPFLFFGVCIGLNPGSAEAILRVNSLFGDLLTRTEVVLLARLPAMQPLLIPADPHWRVEEFA